MPKDTGKKLADMLYGQNPEQAAFGVFPQMKPRRTQQDPEAAKNFPVDLARGIVAGAVGMPADILNIPGDVYSAVTDRDLYKIPYGSEDILKRLPLGSDTPVGQFASGLGTLAGGSANVGSIPRAVKQGAMAVGRAGERMAERVVPQIMERGGAGADILSGLSEGSLSRAVPKRVSPQEQAMERARKNAVEMLGLPEANTPEMRAQALGYMDYLHGTERLDRLLEKKGLDPRRATSGPMPYGTTSPELASSYSMQKADTSRRAMDEGNIGNYFEVAPKDIGVSGRSPIPVERAWYFMSPQQKEKIRNLAPRVGYENLDDFTGKFVVHPEGVNATLSPSQWDYIMKTEAKGNPLVALRSMWHDSGELVREPEMLAEIYRLAGVDAPISQTKAPWTQAQGVLLGKARITNPLDTSNQEQVASIIEPLKQAFAKDRTRLKVGPDQWGKESRYTPKDWISELERDIAKGEESYVWTSIPDKVTEQLKKLGYNGIIDQSGKGGGAKQPVVIPFSPSQVRSRFATFDPAEVESPDLLKKKGGSVHISDNPDVMQLELAGGGLVKRMAKAVGKAAEAAGQKTPVLAEKELTTLQDVHTNLGDRVRAGVMDAQKMMEGFDYKYDKGQRVFTKDSAGKNKPPYTILNRTRVGNQVMREDHPEFGPGMGKPIIDPETGRAMRTPYEPGYRVRMERGPDDWSEFEIPQSAIAGDVEMAAGGAVSYAEGGEITADDLILEERKL